MICNNSYNIVTIQRGYMIRKIIQIGNSWGVIIPLPILNLLKINPVKDKLEFSVEKDASIIKKVKNI